MPRGGRRVGAGRKPGQKGIVLGMNGARRDSPPPPELPPAISEPERDGLLEPPVDLPEGPKACWRKWAPQAIEARTLTPATEPGFRELCLRMFNVLELDKKTAHLGIASQEALPYLRERRGQAAQLNVSLKDFKLTGFGKPATTETPNVGANEWAAFGA